MLAPRSFALSHSSSSSPFKASLRAIPDLRAVAWVISDFASAVALFVEKVEPERCERMGLSCGTVGGVDAAGAGASPNRDDC